MHIRLPVHQANVIYHPDNVLRFHQKAELRDQSPDHLVGRFCNIQLLRFFHGHTIFLYFYNQWLDHFHGKIYYAVSRLYRHSGKLPPALRRYVNYRFHSGKKHHLYPF